MGIALALLLAPWVSDKQCYYCNITETAKCMGILLDCEGDEDNYCHDMGEDFSIPPVSRKCCLRLNHYRHERPVTYQSMTYHSLPMNYCSRVLWDFGSLVLDQNYSATTLAEMTTGQILMGLLWLLF